MSNSISNHIIPPTYFESDASRQVTATYELQHFLNGEATYSSIVDCVNELTNDAPENHDTLIDAFGLIIDQVTFQKPHTLRFSGTNNLGQRTIVVAHYTQVAVRVTYIPRTTEGIRVMEFHTID